MFTGRMNIIAGGLCKTTGRFYIFAGRPFTLAGRARERALDKQELTPNVVTPCSPSQRGEAPRSLPA